MRNSVITVVALFFTVMGTPVAMAGGDSGWVTAKDCGTAMTAAIQAATAVVKSRGEGCLGRKGGSATETRINDDGTCSVKAHYSHHNGSCGKKSKEEQAVCKAIGVSC